jgi:hypothetical protein
LDSFFGALTINNTCFVFVDLDEVRPSKVLHAHLPGGEHVLVVHYSCARHSRNVS